MKLQPSRDFRFELPGERVLVVKAPKLRQIQACLALDLQPGELDDPQKQLTRVVEQTRIMVGAVELDAADLSIGEVMDIRTAIFAHVYGFEPEGALALINALRALEIKHAAALHAGASEAKANA